MVQFRHFLHEKRSEDCYLRGINGAFGTVCIGLEICTEAIGPFRIAENVGFIESQLQILLTKMKQINQCLLEYMIWWSIERRIAFSGLVPILNVEIRLLIR
jgi:hypothetical protein